FFFKQNTAYALSACLVGSEMVIRDSSHTKGLQLLHVLVPPGLWVAVSAWGVVGLGFLFSLRRFLMSPGHESAASWSKGA
ncbi:MAG: hypothetical protein K6T31_06740, partial [Alicyclobacillus sp.]|nr:hypothetical protein [Alicyclobacillus sp.]